MRVPNKGAEDKGLYVRPNVLPFVSTMKKVGTVDANKIDKDLNCLFKSVAALAKGCAHIFVLKLTTTGES